MRKVVLLSFIYCLLCFSCTDDSQEVMMPMEQEEIVDTRIEQLLDIVETHSINRYIIDWEKTKIEVHETRNESGFKPAVMRLLEILGDNHSFYVSNTNSSISASTVSCDNNFTYMPPLAVNIGYVYSTSFSGTQVEAIEYANGLQNQIREQDDNSSKGWIVDVSDNGGGNMWPMIAGLGPLLGNGIHGFFIDPDMNETSWGYLDGASFINTEDNEIVRAINPYELTNTEIKIAVIIDNYTASSGEAATIAFIGKSNVRFFGRPTCGLSTANQSFTLQDGGRLFLTISNMADAEKNQYGSSIMPAFNSTSSTEINAEIVSWFEE